MTIRRQCVHLGILKPPRIGMASLHTLSAMVGTFFTFAVRRHFRRAPSSRQHLVSRELCRRFFFGFLNIHFQPFRVRNVRIRDEPRFSDVPSKSWTSSCPTVARALRPNVARHPPGRSILVPQVDVFSAVSRHSGRIHIDTSFTAHLPRRRRSLLLWSRASGRSHTTRVFGE